MFAKREVRCINPDCGALNRVPRYSIRRIPECGKCHTRLPEHDAIKTLRKLYRFRGLLIFGACAGVLLLVYHDPISALLNPPPACTAHESPRQGVYRWYAATDDVATFTIKTASGSDYFVKLEDALTKEPVMSFFVYGGSTLASNVPLGTFVLKYASGQSWCNETYLFGADTATNQADDTFTFELQPTGDGYTLSHWIVELIRQPGGNLRTRAIPRSQF